MFGLTALFGQKPKLSPLKTEIENLRVKIRKDEARLAKAERKFWNEGGVCCPFCGVSGYSELSRLQDERQTRIDQLLAKIKRDTEPKEKPVVVEPEPYDPEELYPPM